MNTAYSIHSSLADADVRDVLRLIRSENVGSATFFHLVRYCGSVQRALEMAPELSTRGGRMRPITLCSAQDADAELRALERDGATILVYGGQAYPPLLLQTNDAPPLLCVKGDVSLLAKPMVSIVGARNASTAGISFARKLARELGEAGFVVVSGLARGIDTAAHSASLATGTVAVIAGGINTIYPPENEALYREISARGVVVSEMPFGTQPLARSFPARNRIIAGMAQGMVVVEASLKSGSLISAQCAADYHRDVFAVPGSPLDSRCRGTNKLIKEGAVLIESADDVIAHLEQRSQPSFFSEPDAPTFEAMPPEHDMEDIRRDVQEKLSHTPVTIDELIVACNKPAPFVLATLMELELAGLAERHAGGRISLTVGE